MILKYKNYITNIEYSEEDNVFYGKIDGISDLVNFENEDLDRIEQEFHDAVDDYLSFCNYLKSRSYIAVPPGETIKEQLELHGMNIVEFAERIGLSEKQARLLIRGEMNLANDIAHRLETVFGISSMFWKNLESIYRENIEKVKKEEQY